MARVGSGDFSAVSAATNINLDSLNGLKKTATFSFGTDIVQSAAMQFVPGLEVFINGNLLRPVFDAFGAVKVVTAPTSISFAGLNGDYLFYDAGDDTYGIAFPFKLVNGDEVQVRYNLVGTEAIA
jgi:hypothetical protein